MAAVRSSSFAQRPAAEILQIGGSAEEAVVVRGGFGFGGGELGGKVGRGLSGAVGGLRLGRRVG